VFVFGGLNGFFVFFVLLTWLLIVVNTLSFKLVNMCGFVMGGGSEAGPVVRLNRRVLQLLRRLGEVFGVEACRDVRDVSGLERCLGGVVRVAEPDDSFKCVRRIVKVLKEYNEALRIAKEALDHYVSAATTAGDSPVSQDVASSYHEIRRAARHIPVDWKTAYLHATRVTINVALVRKIRAVLKSPVCKPIACEAVKFLISYITEQYAGRQDDVIVQTVLAAFREVEKDVCEES